MTLSGWDWAVLAAYILGMLWIGWAVSSKIKQFKDYFVAGGTLTTSLLVCTVVSTYYELDVTIATSERAYYNGLVAWVWYSRPYYVAIFLAALILPGRLKRHGFMSLPDVLEKSYGKGSRVLGALACFLYCLPMTALAGMAVLFESFGWSKASGLLIGGGVCAIYTLMGGLWADAITDTVQFVLMCVSLAIAVPLALNWVGGFEAIHHLPPVHLTSTGGLSPWLLLSWCAGALTVFVEPGFYQRIFAAKDPKAVRQTLLIGIFLWAAYDWCVTLLGLAAKAAVDQGLLPQALEGRNALITICLTTLPVGLKGFFIAGVLSAAMSSVDTYCLLAGANFSYDIVRPLSRRPLSDKALLRLTRIGVFTVMVAAIVLCGFFSKLSDMWIFMASILVSVVFVPVMGALFGKPARASGLWASILGLTALILFYAVIHGVGEYDDFEESYVWRIGGAEIWREYAVLFALPFSALGYGLGFLSGGASKASGSGRALRGRA